MVNIQKLSNFLIAVSFIIVLIYAIIGNAGITNLVQNQTGSPKFIFLALAALLIFFGIALLVSTIKRYREGFFTTYITKGLRIEKEKEPYFFYLMFIVNLAISVFLISWGLYIFWNIF